ncbi:MAG: glucose 1-dehydrogenase [Dehalococcoidales bacterium]|nr:glucose 1-dehydrogenase [Dehalococcoidales bacterium]
MEFEGKVAIVTGGGQGIGKGIATHLADLGANIAIADLNLETAGAVVKEIEAKGRQAMAVKTDVSNFADTQKMAAEVVAKLGKIDILVNNAGYVKPEQSFFMKEDVDYWQKVISICYNGVIYCSRSCLEYMVEKKYGKIVSIASDAGRVGQRGQTVYSGAKGAVIAFSKALAQEVARYGVNVNCVSPGATDTGVMTMPQEMHDKIANTYLFKRMALPADHANAVAFLASDKSNYITGQTISVSSGYTMF